MHPSPRRLRLAPLAPSPPAKVPVTYTVSPHLAPLVLMGTQHHPHSPGANVLCEKLKAEFAKGPRHNVEAVQKLLEGYIRDGTDWEEVRAALTLSPPLLTQASTPSSPSSATHATSSS